jgi:hypothetical protein
MVPELPDEPLRRKVRAQLSAGQLFPAGWRLVSASRYWPSVYRMRASN